MSNWLTRLLGIPDQQASVFTNKVGQAAIQKGMRGQSIQTPNQAFVQGLALYNNPIVHAVNTPGTFVNRVANNVLDLPTGVGTAVASPFLNVRQDQLNAQADAQHNALIKQLRATPDKQTRAGIAAQLNKVDNPQQVYNFNPNVTDPNYAKRIGGTFFDVATLAGGAPVDLGANAAKFAGESALKKLATYSVVRGAEGAAYGAGRALSQGEGLKQASKAALTNAAGAVALNTIFSPKVVGAAASEAGQAIANEAKRVVTPDAAGRLPSSPGFAKVPGVLPEGKNINLGSDIPKGTPNRESKIIDAFNNSRKQIGNDAQFYNNHIVPEANKSTRSADLAMEIMGNVENQGMPISEALNLSLENSHVSDATMANQDFQNGMSELRQIASFNKRPDIIANFNRVTAGMTLEERSNALSKFLTGFRDKGGMFQNEVLGSKVGSPVGQAQVVSEPGRLTPGSTPVLPEAVGQKPLRSDIPANPTLNPGTLSGGQAPLLDKSSSSFNTNTTLKNDINQVLQGGDVKQRGFVTSVQEGSKTPQALKDIVQGTYVVKSDKQLIADSRNLIKSDPQAAERVALNPTTDVHVTIGNQLIDHYLSTGEFSKAQTLIDNMAQSGTELGRAVHAFAQYDKTTPAGAVKFAQNTINQYNKTASKPLQLGAADIQALMDKAHAIQELPIGRERNIAAQQLSEQVNNLIPSSIADKAVTVWKAGLLTSLRTTERNLLGNAVHGVAEVAKDLPATAADSIMAMKTGQRTVTPTIKGTGQGLSQGLQKAKDIYQLGYDPEEAIQKFDVKHVTWGNNPAEQALKKYTDIVFRHMGAQDKPFYNAAFARSLYDQAGAEAINAGQRGSQNFIENLVKNPTEAMKTTATKDAQVAVFQNKNSISSVASAIKNELTKAHVGALGDVLLPFTGVPSSVAGQMAAYSPIGLTKGVINAGKVMSGSEVAGLQRQAAQEIGRGVIGTGIMGLGAYLYKKGLITGNPKDAAEAQQWQVEGKQANSILVNGKWRSINSVGPEALIALAGSKVAAGGGAGNVLGGLGKDFTQQTFLAGVQGPLQAITDSNRYGNSYLKSQAASIVPNIIKDAAKSGDPYQRATNSVSDALKATLPGARNSLPPVRDALGRPVPEQAGANAFLDLFNSKTPNTDAVTQELSRLYGSGNSATPTDIKANGKILGQNVTLNPQQLNQLNQQTGGAIQQNFAQLMQTPEYQGASDEVKAKALATIVDNVRSQGKTDLVTGSKNGLVDTSKLTKSAQLTLAKDSFDKSGQNYQVVGDTVLRRGADGTITATPKVKFDYQVGTAQLVQYKNKKDLKGWLETAQKQIDSINTQLQDPSIDPLEAIQLQNDAQQIQDNATKYQEYGGFTKPKKGPKAKKVATSVTASGVAKGGPILAAFKTKEKARRAAKVTPYKARITAASLMQR